MKLWFLLHLITALANAQTPPDHLNKIWRDHRGSRYIFNDFKMLAPRPQPVDLLLTVGFTGSDGVKLSFVWGAREIMRDIPVQNLATSHDIFRLYSVVDSQVELQVLITAEGRMQAMAWLPGEATQAYQSGRLKGSYYTCPIFRLRDGAWIEIR